MKTDFEKVVFIFFIASIVACSPSTKPIINPIFAKNSPTQSEYKAELIKQLSLTSNESLTYHIQDYIVENNTEKLLVSVKGQNLNATAIFVLEKPIKALEGLRNKKGMSYHGAELKNLKYTVKENEIFLENVASIVD